MNSLISVAIVEDRRDIRESLAILIDGAPGFTCPLTYATAEEAVEVIPSCPPDVVLMDIDLPGINGIEAVRQLKPLCPRTQFMMCTVYDEDEPVFEALKAGANGFILKRTPPHRLLEAIAELHEGGSPMSSSIARKIVGSLQMVRPPRPAPPTPSPPANGKFWTAWRAATPTKKWPTSCS